MGECINVTSNGWGRDMPVAPDAAIATAGAIERKTWLIRRVTIMYEPLLTQWRVGRKYESGVVSDEWRGWLWQTSAATLYGVGEYVPCGYVRVLRSE